MSVLIHGHRFAFRKASPVQSPGFDLRTDIVGWRMQYRLDRISGYPWFDVEPKRGELFSTIEQALALREASVSLQQLTVRIYPSRVGLAVRDWMKEVDFKALDLSTRHLPPWEPARVIEVPANAPVSSHRDWIAAAASSGGTEALALY